MPNTNPTTDVKRGLELFRIVPPGIKGQPRGSCEGCSQLVWSSGAYRVPGMRGIYCSLECMETALFGNEHCRWCGTEMDMRYPNDGTVACRLCCEDCAENYRRHVRGNRSAALGTGKRFLAYLQRKQPAIYRQLMGGASETDAR